MKKSVNNPFLPFLVIVICTLLFACGGGGGGGAGDSGDDIFNLQITYNLNDAHSGTVPPVKSYREGNQATISVPVPWDAVKNGYYFYCWNTKPDGTGLDIETDNRLYIEKDKLIKNIRNTYDSDYVICNLKKSSTNKVTLYGKWKANPSFTVRFNSYDGDTPANPAEIAVVSPAYSVGALPDPPTKAGYYLAGWGDKQYTYAEFLADIPNGPTDYPRWDEVIKSDYISQDDLINTQKRGYFVELTADTYLPIVRMGSWFNAPETTNYRDVIDVFAVWAESHTYVVTFDNQGATVNCSPLTKEVTTPAKNVDALPSNPSRDGYLFAGWFTQPNGQGSQFTTSTLVGDDITVYANWEEIHTYTVTFDNQGATVNCSPLTKEVTTPATMVDALPSNPSKDGYVFGGWYTQPNGQGSKFTVTTPVAADITVYAYWNEIFTVTFDNQGATVNCSPTSKDVVPPATKLSSLPTNPSKTGYIFDGWYTLPGGAGSPFTTNTVVENDMTVYAYFRPYSYLVTFDNQGATVNCSPTTKTVASPNTTVGSLPTDPSKNGFFFRGWYTQPEGAGSQFLASTTVTGPITVYAKWQTYLLHDAEGSKITVTGLRPEAYGLTSIHIPSTINGYTVTKIEESAFTDRTLLTDVSISNTVSSIGMGAFFNCSNLVNINIPTSMSYIEQSTFEGCGKLVSITIPNNITEIRRRAFAGSGLTSITVPSSITSIGLQAFANCTGLTTVTMSSTVPPNVGSEIFKDCSSLTQIRVPSSAVSTYKGKDGWDEYEAIIVGY